MANALYVSPTGSDTNAGTANAPFRTIQAAAEHAQPGTTVHVAAGTYEGGFTTAASGTASAHVTYVSDTPGGAVIVGGGPAANKSSIGGGAGWYNSGSYVDIQGFEIDGSGSQATSWDMGFYNTGSHTTFQNNIVHDILTDRTEFARITASGFGGAGIENDSDKGGTDTSMIGNLVYNIGPAGETSNLVHGIYQSAPGTIANNVVHDVVGDGIELWHGAQNIDIVNNTVDRAGGGGILVGSGDGGSSSTTGDHINVANNIVTNTRYAIYEDGTTGTHNTYTNNLLYNNSSYTDIHLQNGLKASGTIKADPMYVNAAAHDYRLQAGSPAIDAGAASGAPATDYAGNARPQSGEYDVGAYEATAGSTKTTQTANTGATDGQDTTTTVTTPNDNMSFVDGSSETANPVDTTQSTPIGQGNGTTPSENGNDTTPVSGSGQTVDASAPNQDFGSLFGSAFQNGNLSDLWPAWSGAGASSGAGTSSSGSGVSGQSNDVITGVDTSGSGHSIFGSDSAGTVSPNGILAYS